MSKKFNKVGLSNTFTEVGKKDAAKAKVITVQNIEENQLFDYPNNNEDITNTIDLVYSMKANGFTGPIEVTDFGMPEGKYMIVSGHRRRNAARELGIKIIPCIVKTFTNADDVDNYVLLANSHRDTSKDPLLMFRRYKMHESYLNNSGFDGNVRTEIAMRLGLSEAQADRWHNMGKIIEPVIDMYQKDEVGMSSIQPLAALDINEQAVVHDMMLDCKNAGNELTRPTIRWIVDGFKEGKTNWEDLSTAIKNLNSTEYIPHDLKDSGLPLHTYTEENTQPVQSGRSSERSRNNEVRRAFDPIAANADDADRAHAEWEAQQESDNKSDINNSENNSAAKKSANNKSPHGEDEAEKQKTRTGAKMLNLIRNVSNYMGGDYEFSSDDFAADELRAITNVIIDIISEMRIISNKYNISDELESVLEDISGSVESNV